jgi:hypothetical protein
MMTHEMTHNDFASVKVRRIITLLQKPHFNTAGPMIPPRSWRQFPLPSPLMASDSEPKKIFFELQMLIGEF